MRISDWSSDVCSSDLLTEDALYWMAVELEAHPDADVLYSDEDKIDDGERLFDPFFKPDWSPELFLSQNMINHLGVYSRSLVEAVGRFRHGLEGSQDYRSEEHTPEPQSTMSLSYAYFCSKK